MNDSTRLFQACQTDPSAAEELLPLVYDELRRLAVSRMAHESPGQTLQATALVHEAWIRLLGPDAKTQSWSNRGHFFAAAAEAMRRILIDRARKKQRVKHGGGLARINLDDIDVAETVPSDVLLEVDSAIAKLGEEDPTAYELVRLRFFAGLGMTEIASVMDISERSAYRLWAYGRAWLYKALTSMAAVSEPARSDCASHEPRRS